MKVEELVGEQATKGMTRRMFCFDGLLVGVGWFGLDWIESNTYRFVDRDRDKAMEVQRK